MGTQGARWTLRDDMWLYGTFGRMLYPPMGGEGEGGDGGEGGGSFTPITLSTQDEFNTFFAERLARYQRKWEREELPKLKTELAEKVRADIEAEATRKAQEEQGNFKDLYQQVVSGNADAIPKDSELAKILRTSVETVKQTEAEWKELVKQEKDTLPDSLKALLPAELSPQKQLAWIRTAKGAVGSVAGSPEDPARKGAQGGADLDTAIKELRNSPIYGSIF